MSQEFDPYRKWLGIPPKDQPPNHYRLLGIPLFEDDHDVIENAADRQMAHVRTFSSGPHAKLSQRILNELAAAKVCLLDPAKKQDYDSQLRATTSAEAGPHPPSPTPLPSPPPPRAVPPDSPPPPILDGDFPAAEPMSDDFSLQASPFRAAVAVNEPPAERATPIPVAPSGAPNLAAPKLGGSPVGTRVRARRSNPIPLVITAVGVGIGFLILLLVLFNSGAFDGPKSQGNGAGQRPAGNGPAGVAANPNSPNRSLPRPGSGGTDRPTPRPMRPNFPRPGSGENEPGGGETGLPRVEIPEPAPPVDRRGQLAAALGSARAAASQRDLEAAKRHLVAADSAVVVGESEDLARIAHLRTLIQYLGEFWNAVRQGVYEKTKIEESFTFRDTNYQLLGREGEMVRYRVNEEEMRHEIRRLPVRDAVAFARRTLGESDPFTPIYVATFLVFEGGEPHLEIARRLWREAADQGNRNPFLAEELGMEIAGLPPPGGSNPTPEGEPMPGELPRPGEPAENDPSRQPVPEAELLAEARGRFRRVYGAEVDRSKSTEQRHALVKLLVDTVKTEKDPALRYILWEQIRDQMTALPSVEGLLATLDEMALDFQIESLREKQIYLGKIQARSAEDNQAVLAACLALFQEAKLGEQFEIAEALGKQADRTARGLRDFETVRRLDLEMKELAERRRAAEQ